MRLGDSGTDLIDGEFGSDQIDAGYGNDTVYGGGDADLIYGYYGADILAGNDGSDVIYGESDNDTLYGYNGDDTLYGDGDGTYDAGIGRDVLSGGAGNDFLNGGGDNDLYIFNFTYDGIDRIGDSSGEYDQLTVAGVTNISQLNFYTGTAAFKDSSSLVIATAVEAADGILSEYIEIQNFWLGSSGIGTGRIEYLQVGSSYYWLSTYAESHLIY